MSTENTAPQPKRVITVRSVLNMLREGKDRDQIKKELALTPAEARALFAHKDIIRKKVRKEEELGIEIVGLEEDEVDAEVSAPSESVPEVEPVADEPEVAQVSEPEASPSSFFGGLPQNPPDWANTAAPAAEPTAANSGW